MITAINKPVIGKVDIGTIKLAPAKEFIRKENYMKVNKKIFAVGAACCLSILFVVFYTMGQNNNSQQQGKPELVERFEKAIKNKESKFTLNKSRFGERLGKAVSSSMRWKLHVDNVSLGISEFDSLDDAKNRYNLHFNSPTQVPVPRTKLGNLGDEAFITVSGQKGKLEFATIIVRKGDTVLDLRSNNVPAAKRFARHFVREIEKRDRGEP